MGCKAIQQLHQVARADFQLLFLVAAGSYHLVAPAFRLLAETVAEVDG